MKKIIVLCIAFFHIQLVKGSEQFSGARQEMLSRHYGATLPLPGFPEAMTPVYRQAQREQCFNYCMATFLAEDGIQTRNEQRLFLPNFMLGVDREIFNDFFEQFKMRQKQKSEENFCYVYYNFGLGPTRFFLEPVIFFSDTAQSFVVDQSLTIYTISFDEVCKINKWLYARDTWNLHRWKICQVCGAQFSCTLTLTIHFDGVHSKRHVPGVCTR